MTDTSQHSILQRIPDIFFQLDEDGKVLYLNEAWECYTGVSRQRIEGAPILDHISEKEREEVKDALQEIRKGDRSSREIEIRFLERSSDDDPLHLYLRRNSKVEEGLLIEGVARRERLGEEKNKGEEKDPSFELFRKEWDSRLAVFPEAAPIPLLEADLKGELLYLNPVAYKLLKESGEKGKVDFLPAEHLNLVGHVARTGKKVEREVNYEGRVYIWLYSLPQQGHELLHIRGTEITEQKRVEGDLLDAIVRVQEEERDRFATELHEGIGQSISAALMRFEDLISDLSPEQREKASPVQELLKGTVQDVRRISQGLMPRILKEFGLVAALEELRERMSERYDVQLQLEVSIRETVVDERIKIGVYRLTQELISFASQTRQVNKCWAQIWEEEGALILLFYDEGGSKDPSTGGSFKDFRKFNSMVRSMHGTIDLHYRENGSPQIYIKVPI